MTSAIKTIATLLLLNLTSHLSAQGIKGQVLDEKEEPLIYAPIQIFQGNVLKKQVLTDFDGNYVIKPLAPGKYRVEVSYPSYDTLRENVFFTADSLITFNSKLRRTPGSGYFSCPAKRNVPKK